MDISQSTRTRVTKMSPIYNLVIHFGRSLHWNCCECEWLPIRVSNLYPSLSPWEFSPSFSEAPAANGPPSNIPATSRPPLLPHLRSNGSLFRPPSPPIPPAPFSPLSLSSLPPLLFFRYKSLTLTFFAWDFNFLIRFWFTVVSSITAV